jgi:hypothetical protein
MGLNSLEIDLQNRESFDRSKEMGLFYSVFDGWAEKQQAMAPAAAVNDNLSTDTGGVA